VMVGWPGGRFGSRCQIDDAFTVCDGAAS
jgi:hypothetical protein